MEIINIVTLSISGLLLFVVGTLRISNPIKNYSKNSGIKLEDEVRGVSSVIFFSVIIILLGTIVPKLTITSFVVAILILLGFAI